MIYLTKKLVTVNVLYYMPDYLDLVQEFIWQTKDIVPEIPRVHKFLNHWKDHIDAPIQEVQISYATKGSYRTVDFIHEDKKWH
jgi:uncharacterized protein Usg